MMTTSEIPRTLDYTDGAVDALITVLFAIQPLIGHSPEMHKKFHDAIYTDYEQIFGLTAEDIDKKIDSDYDKYVRKQEQK